MYFVKVGKSKFKHKGKVGEIFADMDNTQYLFQQATSGTMYDMKKKLDYTLWDAVTPQNTQDWVLKNPPKGPLFKKPPGGGFFKNPPRGFF